MSNHQQYPNHPPFEGGQPAPRFQVRQSSHPGYWEAYDTAEPGRRLMNATLHQQEAYAEADRLNLLPVKKKSSKKTALIVVGSVLGGLVLIGVLGGTDEKAAEDGPLPGTVPTSTATADPSPDPVVTPTNKPAPVKTTAPKPVPTKTTQAPKPKPVVYKKLTKREWAKIAKSPDAHAGEAYTVYGVVTQFDSATGDDQFRADVDGVKHTPSYGFVDYPTNTLMTNIMGDLSDLVEDDLFTAKVVVIGAYSYDTQIGGETTVPQLSIISIKVTGSVK